MESKILDFKKYVGVVLKLTKLQDNRFYGEHPNGVNEGAVNEGFLHLDLSNQYQCLFILDGPDRYFHTSQIRRIEEHQGYDLVTTLNSVYRVDFLMSAIPGVQQKYSVRLDSSE